MLKACAMSPRLFILLFTVFAFAVRISLSAVCYRRFNKNEFPSCQLLSPTYALHWKLNDGNVSFAVDVDEAPSGWVSLGVSEAGGMRGGDIWMLKISTSGEWIVQDMHSQDFVAPLLDAHQDVSLVGTPVTTINSMAAVITRKLQACDAGDLSIISNVRTAFIWAHSPQTGYHGPVNRGSMLLTLDPAETQQRQTLSTTKTVSLLMPNITVSRNSTSFMCTNFEVPSDRKYHMTQTGFNVSSELVHHLAMLGCTSYPSQGLGKVYECEEMPTECSIFTMAWAPGVNTWSAPEEAAIPLVKYYALQVHYDNPRNLEGRKDNSGVTVYYGSVLRKYDMGVLILGQMNLTIPGSNPHYTAASAVCPAECTTNFSQPLTIVHHAFHMHTLGKSIKTQIVRDGKELMPLAIRQRWDFNHQNFNPPAPGTDVLMPGDAFITTCTYDSSKRNATTTYGESTREEMCFDFIVYYPAQNAISCMTVRPGLASCTNDAKFEQWLQDKTKQTAPPPTSAGPKTGATPVVRQNVVSNQEAPSAPATTPAGSAPDTGGTGTGASSSDRSAGNSFSNRLTPAVVEMAVNEGFLTMYNATKYEAGGFAPYKAPDGCPGFLDAAGSNSGVEDGTGEGVGSGSGQEPAAPSSRTQQASGVDGGVDGAMTAVMSALLAVVLGCLL